MPDMRHIELRQATADDVPSLLTLKSLAARRDAEPAEQGWLDSVLSDLVADAAPFSYSSYVLAIIGGVIVGALCLSWIKVRLANEGDARSNIQDELMRRMPPGLFISDMAVIADFRRQGVAQSLLIAMEGLAAEIKVDRLGLLVDSDNRPAVKLYRKAGFRCRAKRLIGDGAAMLLMVKSVRDRQNLSFRRQNQRHSADLEATHSI